MSRPTIPDIDCEQNSTMLMVSDVMKAVDFYTQKLGFTLGFTWGDPPETAGVNLGKVQLFLTHGTPGPKGCTVCFVIGRTDELYGGGTDELYAFQKANGVEVVAPVEDRPYGMRDYTIRDLDGYLLRFGHRLLNTTLPLKIERVDVPLRLEKRLAALLEDLAVHKRMSLDSCLEEILLHTCEGASPHSARTLRYVQELKEKHGIDYDAHAGYGFVEK